jgi:hypothetical protein
MFTRAACEQCGLVKEEFGCCQSNAYGLITKAEVTGAIQRNGKKEYLAA